MRDWSLHPVCRSFDLWLLFTVCELEMKKMMAIALPSAQWFAPGAGFKNVQPAIGRALVYDRILTEVGTCSRQ